MVVGERTHCIYDYTIKGFMVRHYFSINWWHNVLLDTTHVRLESSFDSTTNIIRNAMGYRLRGYKDEMDDRIGI